ncbi:MAG: hypothetical protein Q8R91_07090 [Candidatus Omnitrophota bacterium]|nr:hypothetical protein [Candidatus Omnitrophota bacterium]
MPANRRGGLSASLAGAFLAGVTISLIMGLPRSRAFGLLAILLAGMATVYLGAALSTDRREQMLLEGMVAGVFVTFATLSVWGSPLFLVVGYLAHGLWDLAHHRSRIPTRIVAW